jgi:glycosyltransferase involved in cell wall biosynthesis
MDLIPLPKQPLVSIVIANYNYARYLGQALDSVLTQTYQNFEVCICDDGSADNSVEVLAAYQAKDSRIRFVTQRNQGMAPSWNRAFSMAAGSIITFLDSDDVWLSGRIERVVGAFEKHPRAGIVLHSSDVIDASNRRVGQWPVSPDEGWLAAKLLKGERPRFVPTSGISLRYEVADAVFPLPGQYTSMADSVVMDRAAILAPVVAIDERLALYRIHGSNLTGIGAATLSAARGSREFYERLWSDRAAFALRHHGLSIDPNAFRFSDEGRIYLAEAIFSGVRPPDWKEILKGISNRRKRYMWHLMLSVTSVGSWLLRASRRDSLTRRALLALRQL